MFTDIKGYASMMGTDEARTIRLVKDHLEIVREIVPRHVGEEHETIGDAFVVLFDSADPPPAAPPIVPAAPTPVATAAPAAPTAAPPPPAPVPPPSAVAPAPAPVPAAAVVAPPAAPRHDEPRAPSGPAAPRGPRGHARPTDPAGRIKPAVVEN
jgi:class 3 adenylate cyclase